MSLKAGDLIRFKDSNQVYRLVYSDILRKMFFQQSEGNYGLYCAFDVIDKNDIKEEEFNVVYKSDAWSHEDGSPLFGQSYSIGQRFIKDDEEYILSQVGMKMCCLVGLTSGNYWAPPVFVGNSMQITQDEFINITDGGWFVKK